MVELDKLKIFNSFITVVRLIKGVRNDLTGEIDAIKSKNSVGINDETESTESVWSSSKVKQFVTNTVNAVIGGADENSDTLAELAEAIKAKAATTEGLLSVNAKQELTDEQKITALENLGITKEFLVKLLVNDTDISDANLWSSRKVDTLVQERIESVVTGELATDEELEAALANVYSVPAPEKSGQLLVTVLEGDEVVAKWIDQPKDKEEDTVTQPIEESPELVAEPEPETPVESAEPVVEPSTPDKTTEPTDGDADSEATPDDDAPSDEEQVAPAEPTNETEETPVDGENTSGPATEPTTGTESDTEEVPPADNGETEDAVAEEENTSPAEEKSEPTVGEEIVTDENEIIKEALTPPEGDTANS